MNSINRIVLFFAFCTFALICSSCSGSRSGGTPNYEKADLTIAVDWASENRSLLFDCKSVEVRVLEESNRTVLFEAVINRPANIDVADQRKFPLVVPKGRHLVLVRAFDQVQGAGDQLSSSGSRINFIPGSANRVTILIGAVPDPGNFLQDVLKDGPNHAKLGDPAPEPTILVIGQSASSRNHIVLTEGGFHRRISPIDGIINGKFARQGFVERFYSSLTLVVLQTLVRGEAIPSNINTNAVWPCRGGNPSRQNQTRARSISVPVLRTVTLTGQDDLHYPLIAGSNGETYFYSTSSTGSTFLSRFDQGANIARWRVRLTQFVGNISEAILANDGTMYVASGTVLFRIDSATGTILASRDQQSQVESLQYVAGKLFFGATTADPVSLNRLSKIEAPTSTEYFTADLLLDPNGSGRSPLNPTVGKHPAVAGDYPARLAGATSELLLFLRSGGLVITDQWTGNELGFVENIPSNSTTVVFNNQYAAVVSADQNTVIKFIDLHSQRVETLRLQGYKMLQSIRPVCTSDGVLYVACEGGGHHIFAFDIRTGTENWRDYVPYSITSLFVTPDNNILFKSIRENGQSTWKFLSEGSLTD